VSDAPFRVGVIADTHGHLDEGALRALSGVDLLLHAGDVGSDRVLEALRGVAPVVAVTGNGDEALQHRLPWDQRVRLGASRVLLCHWWDNFGRLHPRIERELAAWRPHVLVYGHTHEARIEHRDGVLLLNPGYAGPPGLGRSRSVARLHLDDGAPRAEIVAL